MDSAENLPSSHEIPSNPEVSNKESKPLSMAAASQANNETMPVIKEPPSLEGDQGVDMKGEVSMDTSLTKEETDSKKEPDSDQLNTTPDLQEGELETLSLELCSCTCMCVFA